MDFYKEWGESESSNPPKRCALGLRKHLLLVAVAAVLILIGSYWYIEYFSKGVGLYSADMAGDRAAVGIGEQGQSTPITPAAVNWIPPSSGATAPTAPPTDFASPPVAALTGQRAVGVRVAEKAGPTIIAGTPPPHTDGREMMDCTICHNLIAPAGAQTVAEKAGPTIIAGTPAPHTDGREMMDCTLCHNLIAPAGGRTVAWGAGQGGAPNFSGPRPDLAMNVAQRGGFADIASKLRNSVVNIEARIGGAGRTTEAPAPKAKPNVRFAKPSSPLSTRPMDNIGSGIIVRGDGYILTNYHVVRGAVAVFVTVFDDLTTERYQADVVKVDESVDLALLKITTKSPLVPASLGDSDRIRVADEVIAIGSPFGLGQTVSRGIVSAMHKSLVIEGILRKDLIQTEAAINTGNSGGPLVHENGTVIGINTAIYTPTGAFAGVGFAVPSNQVKMFVGDVIPVRVEGPVAAGNRAAGATVAAGAGGAGNYSFADPPTSPVMNVVANRVVERENNMAGAAPAPGAPVLGAPVQAGPRVMEREDNGRGAAAAAGPPVMGVSVRTMEPMVAERLGQPAGRGVFVQAVDQGSPAAWAGLRPGDIILKLDGRRIRSEGQLARRVAALENGETVRVRVLRDRRRRDLHMTVVRNAAGVAAAGGGGMAQDPQARWRVRAGTTVGGDAMGRVPTVERGIRTGAAVGGGAMGQGPTVDPGIRTGAAVGGGALGQGPMVHRRIRKEFNWRGMEIDKFIAVRPAGTPQGTTVSGGEISDVDRVSPAAMAGLRKKDVIVEINGHPVGTPALMDRAIRNASGRGDNLIRVLRGGRELFVFT